MNIMVCPLPPLGVGSEILDATRFDAKSSGALLRKQPRCIR